jgi:uncharacterized membrane protein
MTGATRKPGGPLSSWYRDGRPEEIHVTIARWLLAAFMAIAGIGHFTAVDAFTAQVPPWMPWPTAVIYVSGVIELGFAIALVATRKHRALVGWLLAGFYVVIFPGNISQFLTDQDAFGLDTDLARGVRLLFQPVLIVWALWCTGAWREFRQKRKPKG